VFELPWPEETDDLLRVRVTREAHTVERRFAFSVEPEPSAPIRLLDPELHVTWGYCRRGSPEVVSSVPRGPGYVRFQRSSGTCGGVRRPAFAAPPVFDHEPHGAVFGQVALQLPDEPTDLQFGTGITDTSPSSDGVVFCVRLTDAAGAVHELFRAVHTNGPWRDERVSLAPFAGQWVELRFETDCGANDDPGGDSARWAEPLIAWQQTRWGVALKSLPAPEEGGP
jgi:hypothetical protein